MRALRGLPRPVHAGNTCTNHPAARSSPSMKVGRQAMFCPANASWCRTMKSLTAARGCGDKRTAPSGPIRVQRSRRQGRIPHGQRGVTRQIGRRFGRSGAVEVGGTGARSQPCVAQLASDQTRVVQRPDPQRQIAGFGQEIHPGDWSIPDAPRCRDIAPEKAPAPAPTGIVRPRSRPIPAGGRAAHRADPARPAPHDRPHRECAGNALHKLPLPR